MKPSASRPCKGAASRLLGAHVSVSGGLFNAPANALEIGANAFALFTRNQRQWKAAPVTAEEAESFKKACQEGGFNLDGQTPYSIIAHDSYLINLGHPGEDELKRSRAAFIEEMRRCQTLGVSLLNFHPGSHLDKVDPDQCLTLIAQSIDMALEETEGVIAVVENTAGQGTNLGHSLEQLATILERVKHSDRTGVCIDTCHAFAAGYDLAGEEGYEQFMARLTELLGPGMLRAMHLNDSKNVLGKRVDRHAPLGKGEMGIDTFRRIVQDPRTEGIPLILETPERENWGAEIERLRGFARPS